VNVLTGDAETEASRRQHQLGAGTTMAQSPPEIPIGFGLFDEPFEFTPAHGPH
jgi:hypothetical protein